MHKDIRNQQRGLCPKRPNICVSSAEQHALSTAPSQPQSRRTYPSLCMASQVAPHRTVNWTLICIHLYAGRTLHLVTGSQQVNHKTLKNLPFLLIPSHQTHIDQLALSSCGKRRRSFRTNQLFCGKQQRPVKTKAFPALSLPRVCSSY